MSFLAYVLRGANDSLRAYQDQIPRAIVRMLQDCPPEAASTRKVRYVGVLVNPLLNLVVL